MLQFINYFFVPAIALLLYEGREGLSSQPFMRLLALYMSFAAVLAAGDQIVVVLILRSFARQLTADGLGFTLIALVLAVLLGLFVRLVRTYVTVERKDREEPHA